MGKKRNKKGKKSKGRTSKQPDGREQFVDEPPVNQRRVAAYQRLMEAEQILYDRWMAQARPESMSWIGELVGFPIEETNLWVMALGERVAALGGQLEVSAVFGDERVTLIREPTLAENPIDPSYRGKFDEQELTDELEDDAGDS